MNKFIIRLGFCLIAVTWAGCQCPCDNIINIVEERDSLLYENLSQQTRLMKLNEYVQTNSELIDSLTVFHLKEELAKKEKTISMLQNKIAGQRRIINDKEAAIAIKDSIINNLKEINQNQERTRVASYQKNKCYCLVATRKELQNRGILTKRSFLKESRLLIESRLVLDKFIDLSPFQEVDKRDFKHLVFVGNNPKILTNMPESAYTLSHRGSTWSLVITDSSTFWKASKFLIIQIDGERKKAGTLFKSQTLTSK